MAAFHHRALYDETHFERNLYRCIAGHGLRVGLQVGKLDFPLVPSVFLMGREYYGVPSVDDEHQMICAGTDLNSLLVWLKQQMAKQHTIDGPFLWLDKTPKNAIAALEFLRAVPGSRFIHMIRDGRDVVASLSKRYAHEAPGHDPSTYLIASMARWCFDTHAALRARNEPGYLEVRYEDFVHNPLDWTNRILKHLNRPEINHIETNRHSEATLTALHNGAKPTWSASPDAAISTKAVGKWKQRFPKPMVDKLREFRFQVEGTPVEFHFGQQLSDLGYA